MPPLPLVSQPLPLLIPRFRRNLPFPDLEWRRRRVLVRWRKPILRGRRCSWGWIRTFPWTRTWRSPMTPGSAPPSRRSSTWWNAAPGSSLLVIWWSPVTWIHLFLWSSVYWFHPFLRQDLFPFSSVDWSLCFWCLHDSSNLISLILMFSLFSFFFYGVHVWLLLFLVYVTFVTVRS